MRRKTLSISLVLFTCLALILCSTGSETFRWSLSPTAAADEGVSVSKITMDLATAMLAEKDALAGATEYAKGKYEDWVWEIIGGYENLIRGNLVGEAYIVQIHNKAGKIQEALDAIQAFVLAVDGGRYDEALFAAVDLATVPVDHPLVSLTWESAKFTYESHKAVEETRVGILIEQLYDALHRDRRLFASSDGEMAQIPETSSTVDYFFDKYIVTDSSTREMVKAYVETRLGEQWPEQSLGSWLSSMKAIGSGVDVAEAEEIEALTGEWRNAARRWILSIIQDVNLEVRKWHYRAEMRRNKAAFEVFVAQYRNFYHDLPTLLQMYERAAAIRADLVRYNGLLTEWTSAQQRIQGELNRMTKADPVRLNQLYGEAMDYRRKAMNARADMLTINEFSLVDAFEALEHQWGVLQAQINDKIPPPPSSVGDAMAAVPIDSDYTDEYMSDLNYEVTTWFSDFLEPIPVPDDSEIEQYRQEFLEKLYSREGTRIIGGSFGEVAVYDGVEQAEEVLRRWNGLRPSPEYGTRTIQSAYRWYYGLHNDAIDMRVSEVEAAKAAAAHDYLPEHDFYLERAADTVRTIYHEVIYPTAYAYFGDLANWMSEQIEAARILRQARATQYAGLMSLYNEAYRYLRDGAGLSDMWIQEPQGDPIGIDESLQTVSESVYLYYTGIGYDVQNLALALRSEAASVMGGWLGTTGVADWWSDRVEAFSTGVEAAHRTFGGVDLPSDSEAQELRSFVASPLDPEDMRRLKQAISAAGSQASSMQDKVADMSRILETDYYNRRATADWLSQTADEWEAWIDAQLKKGYIKRYTLGSSSGDFFTWNLPEGIAFSWDSTMPFSQSRPADAMVMATDPYPHFMTDSEISSLAASMRALGDWSASSGYRFMKQYVPETAKRFDEMLEFKRVGNNPSIMPLIVGAEPNFVHPNSLYEGATAVDYASRGAIVWESSLDRAVAIATTLSHKQADYEERLAEIRDLVPSTLAFATEAEQAEYRARIDQGEPVDYSQMFMMLFDSYRTPKVVPEPYALDLVSGFELGQKYIGLCDRLHEIIMQEQLHREEELRLETERRAPFYALAAQIDRTIDIVRSAVDAGEYEVAVQFDGDLDFYEAQFSALRAQGPDPDGMVTDTLAELTALITDARIKLEEARAQTAAITGQIQAFYDEFARAYESKNTSAVLRLIDDDWEAADHTDLWDLEETLDRNFRVFDEIDYKVSNLRVGESSGDGLYLVTYDLTITSRIYRNNIRHEEKSVVEEEIRISPNGKGLIMRTRRGQFWRN
jgi:hypothetical protein